MTNDPLLQPFQLKHLHLRNRLLSTAHEPSYTEDGFPKERYRLYHSEKAKGGIAMTMIGGSSVVAPDSPQAFGNITLYKDECVRWLRELADDVHDKGAAVMIQITHLGSRTNWNKADWLPVVAPSPIPEPAHRAYPKAMEDWDIERIVTAYADCAEKVKAAGLDGLELEGASHIIAQSWSPRTNRREDEYGGSLDNRMRLVMRILSAVRERVGQDFVVGVRAVCDEEWDSGLEPTEGIEIARRLSASGLIDFINVIRGHAATDAGLSNVIPSMGARSAPHLDFAGVVRSEARIPTFHAARIQDVATARHAISSGKLDMVGMTRAHIADPHIIQKILERREDQIRPCVGMGYCIDSIYNGQAVCIHNAATGREGHLPQLVPKSTGPARKVVVVGAGPGGLEAARVAAERGHTVIVFEAAQHAGGQILTAAALKRRREILGIVDWRLSELARLGVEIRYNHYAEAEDVLAADPDYVVIATGGLPNTDFLRSGAEFATTSWDVLNGVAKVSGSVLVYDENGSHPGMTIAEFVANTTNQLEVITPERTLAIDIGATSYPPYFKTLNQVGAKITLNLRLESVERRGNKLVGIFDDEYAGVRVEKAADYIVVENGTLPMEDLYFSLKEHSINGGAVDYNALLEGETQAIERNPEKRFRLFRIGDAVASRNIHAAIYDAHRLMINA